MDSDNQNATVWNVLVANASLSDKAAYDIVKTIFDRKPELVTVHKEAENFDLKYQSNDAAVIPFHPGAIRYFAEKGVKLN